MNELNAVFNEQSPEPRYVVSYPDQVTVPFIFNSPHSGRHYTPDFIEQSRLSPLLLRKSEDAMVDYLYQFATDLGAPMLAATFPRAFVDVNREPYELDPLLVEEPLPANANSKSMRVAAGLGTVARVVGYGLDIYKGPLSLDEVMWRIEEFYIPYHQKLSHMIETQVNRFDMAVLIDCHSMPSNQRNPLNKFKPDIVIGDCYGNSAHQDIVLYLIELLEAQGLSVSHNMPYAGGYITENYGNPDDGVHAIQVEINRSLYMDEVLLEAHSGFSTLGEQLETAFSAFVRDVTATIQPQARAAE